MIWPELDNGGIATLESGASIIVYPGEGADDECFAGEMLDPPEKMFRLGLHVSCMWDRAKVVSFLPKHHPEGQV